MTKIFATLLAIVAFASLTGAAPIVPSSTDAEIDVSIPTLVTDVFETPAPIATMDPVPAAAASTSKEPTITVNSNSDPFSSSVRHQGKATWFTHSYGACNVRWNGFKEPVVALNAHQMGIMSWGNPVCNRKVRIVNKDDPSKSVVARVVDKCPGNECDWGSLDLSPFAFNQLGHPDKGILNIYWNYV
ncbi:hypothetical protein BGX28_008927 [Mortierella sp. GBA30]|nr:hypothetical protein BGX28_008927 [Mortierella sp. GBA30]